MEDCDMAKRRRKDRIVKRKDGTLVNEDAMARFTAPKRYTDRDGNDWTKTWTEAELREAFGR